MLFELEFFKVVLATIMKTKMATDYQATESHFFPLKFQAVVLHPINYLDHASSEFFLRILFILGYRYHNLGVIQIQHQT